MIGAIFFLCITLMFLDFTGTLQKFLSWMAKVQFLPAVMALNFAVIALILIVTLLFGRIYCSVICPMGVFQDGVAHVHNWIKKNRYTYSKAHNILRYVFLAVFVLALIFGVGSLTALLAPYSAYGRIVQNLFAPVYQWCNNGLAAIAEHYNSYAIYSSEVWIKSAAALVTSIALLLIIGFLAWRGGRTYCNTVCPVGTFLGLISRFSLIKVHIDHDRCIKCGMCTRNCKASCIDYKNGTVDHSRCVTCGNCIGKCHKDAIYYGRPRKQATLGEAPQHEGIDKGKRAFLIGSGIALATTAMAQAKKKVDGGLAAIEQKQMPERKNPITPPGSMSARNMAHHCVACQLCVAECPNQVLQPSGNLDTFMQPIMSYEHGYCRPECTRCSQVCPAGAIKPITREEKSSIQIGHAVWTHFLCIPTRDKNEDGTPISCGNCARHCPTGAITMSPLDENDEKSPMVPTVNEAKCIGCGACEHVCPSRPIAAIHVEGHEDHRTI